VSHFGRPWVAAAAAAAGSSINSLSAHQSLAIRHPSTSQRRPQSRGRL
jgi:hypothetical protein